MNQSNEKILFRVKGNRLLFIIKNVWNTIWFAIGILLSIGLGTLLAGGLARTLLNGGEMNQGIITLGMLLIPLLTSIRILHIVLLRKNQFYIVSTKGVTSEGGVLTRFSQTLRLNEIQSVSYTQTLIQQILGCGNIVISSAATHPSATSIASKKSTKSSTTIAERNHTMKINEMTIAEILEEAVKRGFNPEPWKHSWFSWNNGVEVAAIRFLEANAPDLYEEGEWE